MIFKLSIYGMRLLLFFFLYGISYPKAKWSVTGRVDKVNHVETLSPFLACCTCVSWHISHSVCCKVHACPTFRFQHYKLNLGMQPNSLKLPPIYNAALCLARTETLGKLAEALCRELALRTEHVDWVYPSLPSWDLQHGYFGSHISLYGSAFQSIQLQ